MKPTSMRWKWCVCAVALVAALGATVTAVRFGVPDNGEHPYVGLLVFDDEAGVPQWRCTGTLLSPTVVLTAGHCADLEAGARFYLDEKVMAASGYPFTGGIAGTAYAYPLWRGGLYLPDTGDAGVVVLSTPVSQAVFPRLAPVGGLDDLARERGQQDVNFEVVGYGLQAVKPVELAARDRLKAWVQLVNLKSALTDGFNLQTTNAKGKGTGGGGTCFGDSGGAIFTASHEIVAVNSFVLNENCTGSSFGYRVDTADVQAWVLGFLD